VRPDQAQTIWDRIVGAWPNAAWPDMTRRQWLHDLLSHDVIVANLAFERIRQQDSGVPTWGRFRENMRALAARDTTAPELGPHAGADNDERGRVRELISATRARYGWYPSDDEPDEIGPETA